MMHHRIKPLRANTSFDCLNLFQVDLLTETRLTKIATQGFNVNGVASYIKMFTLQTSEDGVNFKTYQQHGKNRVRKH